MGGTTKRRSAGDFGPCRRITYKPVVGASRQFKYTKEALQRAVNAVRLNRGTLRDTAHRYNVPKSTLSDKLRGVHPLSHGGQPCLNPDTEKALVSCLLTTAEWGCPLRCSDIKDVVQRFLDRNKTRQSTSVFKTNKPGRSWMRRFLRRSPQLTIRLCQNVKRSRAAITADIINPYFDNLEARLIGIPPTNIINYDETNFVDDPQQECVVVKRGCRHPERIMDSSKTATSVMFATTADGRLLPPFVVYKSTHTYETWTENGIPNAIYRSSKSGWFDMELFEQWFLLIIVPFARKCAGRSVMIGDNLPSHVSPEVIRLCEELDILFILLPPNSTHLTEPNDVGVFALLKKSYRAVLTEWKRKHRGVLPKCEFPRVLKNAVERIPDLSKNIKSSFRACGISPVDRNQVLKRLAGYAETSDPTDDIGNVLVDHPRTMRSEETATKTRGKRISVPAGVNITTKDLPQSGATQKPKERRRGTANKSAVAPETVDQALRVLDAEDECEIDDPGLPDIDDQAESEDEGRETDRSQCDTGTIKFDEKDFVLVQLKSTGKENCVKHYVGYIANILDNGIYEVEFFRQKKTSKEVYFVAFQVPDITNIEKCQILCKLCLQVVKRGRHYFRGMPIDLALIS